MDEVGMHEVCGLWKGMPAEQVLRAMLIKQMNGFSYEELAFHLADSNVYRWFCRLGIVLSTTESAARES